MSWEGKTVSQMREEFVKAVLSGKATKSELCRQYGISRPTGDKWIRRYLAGLPMEDMRRTPHNMPTRTPDGTEQIIVALRNDYNTLGGAKLRRILQDQGHDNLPSARTFDRILKRNGLITKEASQASAPYTRFEKADPNDMWQADYKGHFALKNGVRCHPLNILDDCTRFNICCEAMGSETFREIKQVMVRLFREYGLPKMLLCDNGNPWGTQQSPGYTSFEVWLMELGILTVHGRIRHPQTQGKDESFNRSFTRELLNGREFLDMEDAQKCFSEYRKFYNEIRPHHALNLDTPASRYRRSPREYRDKIDPWVYPEGSDIRKIKSTGYFTWNGQGYFLSEAFGNKEVMVKYSAEDNCCRLHFREFVIARINTRERGLISRRAYLANGDPRPFSER